MGHRCYEVEVTVAAATRQEKRPATEGVVAGRKEGPLSKGVAVRLPAF
jgi:hypothetical protein